MNVKSYFAGNIDAALRLAREEMGEDALLLSSRPSPPEARKLGAFEVVFAAADAVPVRPAAPAETGGGETAIAVELANLRSQIERLAGPVLRNQVLATAGCYAAIAGALLAAEIAPHLIRQVLDALDERNADPAAALSGAVAILADLLPTMPPSPPPAAARTIAVIGPPGAGKTSALIKLAIREGLAARRSGVLVSADCRRVGGTDQLRSFAAILGVPFEAVDPEESLDRVIAEHAHRQRVWIDTPGYSAADLVRAPGFPAALLRRAALERHLVLSAAMRPADLSRMLDRFAVFEPTHLLFTHLDEASVFGPLFNEACRTRLSVSYLSSGTRIPDDLEEASAGRLAALALGEAEDATASRPPLRERRQAA